jgi:UDP-GlcNAc:undecaprenyl-phosphate/decaprenyl-phosphate GlcNAc-1-phosphate transferase
VSRLTSTSAGEATTLFLLLTAFCLSVAGIVFFSRLASRLHLVDVPGGRKAHASAVPLVGGLAIFLALLITAYVANLAPTMGYFLLALSCVLAVGCWDDMAEIPPRTKFAIQLLAAAIMIWGAGLELRTVGDLIGWKPIGLWIFVVPVTMLAVVGVVNSINMMDGLDGLAGSIALIAFAWYAAAAATSARWIAFVTAIIFCGAIVGFLLFNLRLPWQRQARVFLGDAGSMMIGFALGWLAIDLTQGPGRTFSPIAALWVLMLPLVDCVSVMARRVARRQSPFVADRHHIHHYLQARGFSDGRVLALLICLSAAFGATGYAGWVYGLPESWLFWPFFFGFFAYHFWIQRAWRDLQQEKPPAAPAIAPPEDKVAATG